jgi:hypothetical protein
MAEPVLTSAQRLSRDLQISADALKQWGAGEGEDLSVRLDELLCLRSNLRTRALFMSAEHYRN